MRILPALLLLAACAAPLPSARTPPLLVQIRPDVRVLSLDLQPSAEGLRLEGLLRVPSGARPAARDALAEGLDGTGAVLFRQSVTVRIEPSATSLGGRASAVLTQELPRPAGLQAVHLVLPAP